MRSDAPTVGSACYDAVAVLRHYFYVGKERYGCNSIQLVRRALGSRATATGRRARKDRALSDAERRGGLGVVCIVARQRARGRKDETGPAAR